MHKRDRGNSPPLDVGSDEAQQQPLPRVGLVQRLSGQLMVQVGSTRGPKVLRVSPSANAPALDLDPVQQEQASVLRWDDEPEKIDTSPASPVSRSGYINLSHIIYVPHIFIFSPN